MDSPDYDVREAMKAQRKAINDTRGHVSELLSKCVANGALDAELSKEDRERMKAFLKIYGPLDEKSAYVGSERAGYKTPPGAGSQVGVDDPPMDMRVLLDYYATRGAQLESVTVDGRPSTANVQQDLGRPIFRARRPAARSSA